MSATTQDTLSVSRGDMIELLAALNAAGYTLHVLHEPDSGAGEFFNGIAQRFQGEFFGNDKTEDDGWMEARSRLRSTLELRSSRPRP
jgi:hypothetical protein